MCNRRMKSVRDGRHRADVRRPETSMNENRECSEVMNGFAFRIIL